MSKQKKLAEAHMLNRQQLKREAVQEWERRIRDGWASLEGFIVALGCWA